MYIWYFGGTGCSSKPRATVSQGISCHEIVTPWWIWCCYPYCRSAPFGRECKNPQKGMGRRGLLVWLHCNCCGSNEKIWCSLYMDHQAKSAVVSNETTVCSTKCMFQRSTCWPLGDIWSYSFRSKAYCCCICLESKRGVLHFINLWFNGTCWKNVHVILRGWLWQCRKQRNKPPKACTSTIWLPTTDWWA